MRILIVALCPMQPELGGAQMTINLTASLRELGADAQMWSPFPIPSQIRWWQQHAYMRSALVTFAREKRFDIIDLPSIAITKSLTRNAKVIARSVQPELQYDWVQLKSFRLFRKFGTLKGSLGSVYTVRLMARHVKGWSLASRILCLGSLELDWMKRHFPFWKSKLAVYYNALSDNEQQWLKQIAAARTFSAEGTRFLWVGRWTPQKGVDRLRRFIEARLSKHKQDSFTIAGCGEDREQILPSSLMEETRIRIVKSFSRSELPELLMNHDAGLFTSTVEGWGLSLNEMLESGMPVYASCAGGVPDLKPHYAGLLRDFPPPDHIDPPQRVVVPPPFSWKRTAEMYLRMIAELR